MIASSRSNGLFVAASTRIFSELRIYTVGKQEDTCAIALVASKLYLFPIATRYKKVCHTQKEYTHFAKISLSLNIE